MKNEQIKMMLMNHRKPELSGKEVDFKVKIEIPFSYLQNIGLTEIYLQVFYQIIYFLNYGM